MIEGSCHCGAVRWSFDGIPKSATACNCTQDERIRVSGPTHAYTWGDRALEFHFCPSCGCVAYWRGSAPRPDGRRRIAVNLRLAEPDAVGAIILDHFDGLVSFDDLPRDGRCVADLWF